VSASWSQTTDEVQLRVPVDSSVRGKDVAFEVHPLRLKLAVAGSTLLEGRLEDAGSVRADGEAVVAGKGVVWLSRAEEKQLVVLVAGTQQRSSVRMVSRRSACPTQLNLALLTTQLKQQPQLLV
jgi:hypothetical protein